MIGNDTIDARKILEMDLLVTFFASALIFVQLFGNILIIKLKFWIKFRKYIAILQKIRIL